MKDHSQSAGKTNVLVIGAGASGIAAAIAAARRGAQVRIVERLNACAKKLLASGGGKCNLFNRHWEEKYFNRAARALVRSVFAQGASRLVPEFFTGLGLQVYADADRFFPRSNQAATVVKLLEFELQRLEIPVAYGCQVMSVNPVAGGFKVSGPPGQSFVADRLVLAAGGASYPALGSNGSGFELAQRLGHTIIAPVPAAVPLAAKDKLCHLLQGQKIAVSLRALRKQTVIAEADGELLFTQYGLSGTAALDVSREISVAINREGAGDIIVSADCVPWMSAQELAGELQRKIDAGFRPDELLVGILPNKAARAFAPGTLDFSAGSLAQALKNRMFAVHATRGWNEAEFTAGGVDTAEVDPVTLGSRRRPGVYLCGEVLDVDGCRGGHNLAWAWASGLLAGDSACGTDR